jgi:glyoxylase-like metal-dependent hydrolase (beta-lactamase superfamily II)
MQQLADGVVAFALVPRHGVNAYLLGDVLVDAGMPFSAKGLVKAVQGRPVAAHTLTHVHPDHAGGSKGVAQALGVPVWAPAGDAAALRAGRSVTKHGFMGPLSGFPAVEPERELHEGDALGDSGFVVLDTPGHSPGHVSFWRESDRVLVCGDVVFGMNVLTTMPGLREPLGVPTVDPDRNRQSIRRIAELEPALLLPGHGPPSRDPGALRALAAKL